MPTKRIIIIFRSTQKNVMARFSVVGYKKLSLILLLDDENGIVVKILFWLKGPFNEQKHAILSFLKVDT